MTIHIHTSEQASDSAPTLHVQTLVTAVMSRHVRLLYALFAALALLVVAQSASAQTVLFSDDAEGDPAAKWNLNTPEDTRILPWQLSNSSTRKYRGNQFHGGATSYWAGQSIPYEPILVVMGDAWMQLKNPLVIPADGKTTISLWSLFQNEGDDLGAVEVALDTRGKPKWKTLTAYRLTPSGIGDEPQPGYCNPSHPEMTNTQTFEEVKGDFAAYAGKQILLRINLRYGDENRWATQPCGWYVDDINISTTGTPGKVGTPATPPLAGPPSPAPLKPSVKFGATKLKAKNATLSLKVSGNALRNVTLTLLKGKKKMGTAKVAQMPTGARKVVFKLRKKLKKGSYGVKIAGTYTDGGSFVASGKTKAK